MKETRNISSAFPISSSDEQKIGAIDKNQVTIVISTLNEEDAIGLVLDELRQEGYKNVLVVDGYSTDATVKIAGENGVRVIQQHGQGKTGALKTAIECVQTPFMLFMDGDYSYDPKDIEKFLVHAENYDQIIGSRKDAAKNTPLLNRFGNRMITKVFNVLMGANLSDVCSGMYMLKTETAKKLHFESTGFETEVEMASQIVTDGGKTTEVPLNFRKRIGRKKLSTIRDGLKIMVAIIKLARIYNPTLLFSTLATIALIPGTAILAWVALRVLFFGTWHGEYALLGTILLLLGLQGLTLAMIDLLLKRMERRIKQTIMTRK